MASTVATVNLSSKKFYCYRDGEENYILYNQLLEHFQLKNTSSPSTLQRKKNVVVPSDQYCPKSTLNYLKEAGIVRKEAKKVAVLTVSQAIELLKLHQISIPDFEQQQSGDRTPEPASTTAMNPEDGTDNLQQPQSPATAASSSSTVEENSLAEFETATETYIEPPPCKKAKRTVGQRTLVKQLELSSNPVVSGEMLDLKKFWTCEANYKRKTKAISEVTFLKTRERLQSFLGFVETKTDQSPSLTCLIDLEILDRFITYLKEERELRPGTISGYCQAFTRGLKYLGAVADVDVGERLDYLRQLTNSYQKKARKERPTWQQLSAANKWLHWEEVLEVVKVQHETMESQVKPALRAPESQKYTVLLLYCAVPPGRAQEYRTLKVQLGTTPHQPTTGTENIMHYGHQTILELGSFKNRENFGLQVIDISQIEFLVSHLGDYIKKDRPILLKSNTDHGFLFMDDDGHPFTDAAKWTKYVQSIFKQHTGKHVGPSALRSSFVTYLMDGDVTTNEATLRSVAHAMRHSTHYQREVYDRRTCQDKVVDGVKLTASIAGKVLDADNSSTSDSDDIVPERGDIVGLVEEDSTRSNPLILLGKVLRVNHQKRTVLLAYLQPIKGSNSKYQLDVGNNTWQEKFETLVFPVDIEFDSKSYLYTLRTPKLSIHNAVKK